MDNNLQNEPITPVTNETYVQMNIQRDEWEDKRNNKRLNQGTFTNLWLFIIAFYCLWEIAKDIIPIILGYQLLEQLFH